MYQQQIKVNKRTIISESKYFLMQATKIWKNLPLDLTLLSSVVDYLSDTARQPVRVWLFSHFSNQIFIHHPFYFGIFWEKGPLTAKIKNTILVALESAESLYQSSNFMRSTQNLKKSSLCSEHLLSKCSKHEENCSNFFLRNLNVISLVFILSKFTNSESPIFCLLAWSTVGRDTLRFINWNHATFSNSF